MRIILNQSQVKIKNDFKLEMIKRRELGIDISIRTLFYELSFAQNNIVLEKNRLRVSTVTQMLIYLFSNWTWAFL